MEAHKKLKAGWLLSLATTATFLHLFSSQAVTQEVEGSAYVLCWQWKGHELGQRKAKELSNVNSPLLLLAFFLHTFLK